MSFDSLCLGNSASSGLVPDRGHRVDSVGRRRRGHHGDLPALSRAPHERVSAGDVRAVPAAARGAAPGGRARPGRALARPPPPPPPSPPAPAQGGRRRGGGRRAQGVALAVALAPPPAAPPGAQEPRAREPLHPGGAYLLGGRFGRGAVRRAGPARLVPVPERGVRMRGRRGGGCCCGCCGGGRRPLQRDALGAQLGLLLGPVRAGPDLRGRRRAALPQPAGEPSPAISAEPKPAFSHTNYHK